eukprot:Hpha_TRINITY_DN14319_c0_g1::TRINITY_DN14319_c0_g1_i4::g.87020::m.87020
MLPVAFSFAACAALRPPSGWTRARPASVSLPSGAEVRNFTQRVDHFNAERNSTYQQRYVLDATAWQPGGPIFAMLGAEDGDVTRAVWSYGSVYETCKALGGMCVFIEHRFFGASIPYQWPGGASRRMDPGGVGLLSPLQSLEDAATLLRSLRTSLGAWSSPLVAYGCSLSGTLAVLARLLFPEIVDAAFASSAPLQGWVGIADQFAWRAQLTSNFESTSPGCPDIVRQGFQGLKALSPAEVKSRYSVCPTSLSARLKADLPRSP